MGTTEHFRTCPLCEATCGLTLTMEGAQVIKVRGDDEDVFSKGFICPKGTAVKHLHEDPDRLRTPMIRTGTEWREATWDEAWAALDEGLAPILQANRDAVGVYIGNPTVHSLSTMVMLPALIRSIGTKNLFTAASVDQMPKHVSSGYMFGRPETIAVPDIDRCHYLLIVGANPWVSNGSVTTAPDFRGRVQAISARGGKVVVVDPRRTETAEGSDEHIRIRPGTDAFFLLAVAHELFAAGLVDLGSAGAHIAGAATDGAAAAAASRDGAGAAVAGNGAGAAVAGNGSAADDVQRSDGAFSSDGSGTNVLGEIEAIVAPFTPEAVAGVTGVAPEVIKRIAHELAAAPSAAVYDRIGAHQQEFGTLTSWASDLVTALTGNLDREGGKMFPYPAHAKPDPDTPGGRGWKTGRYKSRVKGYPEVYNQLPVSTLADEIEAPGDGQIRALITIAGNPVLSTPNGTRLSAALDTLDFMVSVDPYLNETTRHANVILPSPSILAKHHYDFAFYGLSVRNIANYSPPLVDAAGPDEWEILARLALIAVGQSATGDPEVVPQMALMHLIQEASGEGGGLEGMDIGEVLETLGGRGPVEQILDLRLRLGPYGDGFGKNPGGLSLAKLEENPHGIDLGPLKPRLPNILKTASGKVELAPPEIVADVARLRSALDRGTNGIVLIGRRQLRSNNSWMHNVASMVRGSNRCTLLVHPKDAERLGLSEGAEAKVSSRVGTIEAVVEISDEMMPGVVSLPHGWGHNRPGTRMSVAEANAGVSSNDLTDEEAIDPLSGNSVMNGIPVTIVPAKTPAPV